VEEVGTLLKKEGSWHGEREKERKREREREREKERKKERKRKGRYFDSLLFLVHTTSRDAE